MSNCFQTVSEGNTSDLESQNNRKGVKIGNEIFKVALAIISLTFCAAFLGGLAGLAVKAEQLDICAGQRVSNSTGMIPYIYYEGSEQPTEAFMTDSYGVYNICLAKDVADTFTNVKKRYWWITLGLALYKTVDNYLKWENIVDSCSHFTGSW